MIWRKNFARKLGMAAIKKFRPMCKLMGPFVLACARGDLPAAKTLKEQNKLTPEEISAVECGALRLALVFGHTQVADWIIDDCGYTKDFPFVTGDWEHSEESMTMEVEDWLKLARARNQNRESVSQTGAGML